ncbi:MAG TPA: hypothetical protein VM617_00510 [Thermoanaerobaculia bacterium]|nr:hypothetical protein [Thermoanaerobaculia bacterium]
MRLPTECRCAVFPTIVLCLGLLAAAGAEAQPFAGRYQARPGPVIACGGFAGECRVMQIEGWIDFEIDALSFPGDTPAVHFADSDLRLRRLDADSTSPFPAPTDLQLSELEVVLGAGDVSFASPPGSIQTVELDLWQQGDTHFVLAGTYDEGCCDRFRYEIGGVLFDWTGPPQSQQALYLMGAQFRVQVGWRDHEGGSGVGTPIAFDDRSGNFWFFRPDNPELMVKVINACEPFGRFWIFAAGLTDVEVEIRVNGPGIFDEKVYLRPAGQPFEAILDTEGFSCEEGVV